MSGTDSVRPKDTKKLDPSTCYLFFSYTFNNFLYLPLVKSFNRPLEPKYITKTVCLHPHMHPSYQTKVPGDPSLENIEF